MKPNSAGLLLVIFCATACASTNTKGDAACRNQLDEANAKISSLEQGYDKEMTTRELMGKRKEAFQSITSMLSGALDDAEHEITVINGRLVVQMPNRILFDSGKATLKEDGKETLGKVAGVLETTPDRDFLLAGHTDNVPIGKKGTKYKSNWELSLARALVVVQFLIEKGIAPARLGAAGFGEHRPVDNNETEEGKAKNRRIEIIIMPTSNEIPQLPESP